MIHDGNHLKRTANILIGGNCIYNKNIGRGKVGGCAPRGVGIQCSLGINILNTIYTIYSSTLDQKL